MFVRLLNTLLLVALLLLLGWAIHAYTLDIEVADWVIASYMSILAIGLVLNVALIIARLITRRNSLEDWAWFSGYFLITCFIFGGSSQLYMGETIVREANVESIPFNSPSLQSPEAKAHAHAFLQAVVDNDRKQVEEHFSATYATDSEVAAIAATLAIQYRRPALLEFFLEKGLPANSIWDGKPLLVTACDASRYQDAKTLLKHGADVNLADDQGMTPLIMASTVNHEELVRLLLDAGADPSRSDESGYRASDYAPSSSIRDMLPSAPEEEE